MKKITIIDYGTSNLKSIEAAFKYLGYDTIVTSDKKKITNSKTLVLPGVGAFPVVPHSGVCKRPPLARMPIALLFCSDLVFELGTSLPPR